MRRQLKKVRERAIRSVLTLAQASTTATGTADDLADDLAQLCRNAAADGIVLLKNADGALPFAPATKVAVFGRTQVDYFAVGYGSGGDVNAPYTWNLLDAMREDQRVRVDEQLATRYEAWCEKNRPSEGFWGFWPRFFEEMPLAADVVLASAERNDAAIIVLGRAAGEARENVLKPGSYYLTAAERRLIDQVTSAFEKVVLVIDTGNLIDLAWTEELGDRLSAIVLAWQGGMESGRAVVDVLTGATNPSGRLTDTIARHYADYPSAANFGGRRFNEYAEDIYVGYRFFETFAPEKVLYPFGFGLSYTEFEIGAAELAHNANGIHIRLSVTNVGRRAGREVVQLYAGLPIGKLGKPDRTLVGFDKTALLLPGDTEVMEFLVPLESLASFDDSGVTGTRSAWVLEPGRYQIFAGQNVREAKEIGGVTHTEQALIRQCHSVLGPNPRHPFARAVARRDALGNAVLEYEPVPVAPGTCRERVLNDLPSPAPNEGIVAFDDVVIGTATAAQFAASLDVQELVDLCRGDLIMNSPLGPAGNAGTFGGITPALRARELPALTTADGPSGIRVNAYASLIPSGTALASTWDTALIEELGALLGAETRAKQVDVLLTPGMNIHRDPLCGRNFEYFSEDPLVTGRVAAAVVRGIQSAGASACPKHFAANNQEVNRVKHDSRVSERALREIYLRGFEIVVRTAKPRTMMTSYNKINGIWSYYNYDLCTTVLRDEWGYEGVVITDWWTRNDKDPDFPGVKRNGYRIRAGADVLMPGSDLPLIKYQDGSALASYRARGGLTLGELQRSAVVVIQLLASHERMKRGLHADPRHSDA